MRSGVLPYCRLLFVLCPVLHNFRYDTGRIGFNGLGFDVLQIIGNRDMFFVVDYLDSEKSPFAQLWNKFDEPAIYLIELVEQKPLVMRWRFFLSKVASSNGRQVSSWAVASSALGRPSPLVMLTKYFRIRYHELFFVFFYSQNSSDNFLYGTNFTLWLFPVYPVTSGRFGHIVNLISASAVQLLVPLNCLDRQGWLCLFRSQFHFL